MLKNEMNHVFLAEARFCFLLETEDKLFSVFLDKKHSPLESFLLGCDLTTDFLMTFRGLTMPKRKQNEVNT